MMSLRTVHFLALFSGVCSLFRFRSAMNASMGEESLSLVDDGSQKCLLFISMSYLWAFLLCGSSSYKIKISRGEREELSGGAEESLMCCYQICQLFANNIHLSYCCHHIGNLLYFQVNQLVATQSEGTMYYCPRKIAVKSHFCSITRIIGLCSLSHSLSEKVVWCSR